MAVRGLLLDTHIVIWLATEPERVPAEYLNAIEESDQRFVSHVSALEIQVKHAKSPVSFEFSLDSLDQSMREFSFRELPFLLDDIKTMDTMQFLHSDPFDRMLMAQAANRNLNFVTSDDKILLTSRQYNAFTVFGG